MALDDFARHPQSKPRADVLLGGEERLEDSLSVFIGYARPIIFDEHMHGGTISLFNASQRHDNRASNCNRVGSVGDEIGENLLDLVLHSPNRRAFTE